MSTLVIRKDMVRDIPKNILIKCTMDELNLLLETSEVVTKNIPRNSKAIKLDLIMRADTKDMVVAKDNNMVLSTDVTTSEVRQNTTGFDMYVSLIENVRNLFMDTLNEETKKDLINYIQRTMALPLGYFVTEEDEVHILFNLIIDYNIFTSEYIGGVDNQYEVVELSENFINLYTPLDKHSTIYLDSFTRMEE